MKFFTKARLKLINKEIWQYSIAIIAPIIVLIITKLFFPILSDDPFLLFIAPVVICAYLSFWSGILCSIISLLLVDYFLLIPLYEINVGWHYIPRLLIFVCLAIIINSLTEKRNQALNRERQFRAEAEAANRAKDQFLAMTSHELRTPLTAISGWIELLEQGKLSNLEKQHAIEVIKRNAKMQTHLIEDLMDLARITNGKLHLDMSNVNVKQVIESAIEVVWLALTSKGIKFNANLSLQPIIVIGDRNRLQQVIWNLLSNAIKFTPPGGEIIITLAQVNNDVVITVSDKGRGIDHEVLPFIFDRFHQAPDSYKKGGLGLGLSIVRYLVEMHGGTIQSHSQGKDKGATFIVTIPSGVNDKVACF